MTYTINQQYKFEYELSENGMPLIPNHFLNLSIFQVHVTRQFQQPNSCQLHVMEKIAANGESLPETTRQGVSVDNVMKSKLDNREETPLRVNKVL